MSNETPHEAMKRLNIDLRTDCIAVFRPGDGCAFYIPDELKGKEPETYVKIMLTLVHMMENSDKLHIQQFAQEMWEEVVRKIQSMPDEE